MSVSYCRWLHATQMAPALLSSLRLLKYIVENTYRETRQARVYSCFYASLYRLYDQYTRAGVENIKKIILTLELSDIYLDIIQRCVER